MTTMTRWEAPRIGYLLTAAMAGHGTTRRPPCGGNSTNPPSATSSARSRAQARLAVQEAGIPLQIDFTGLADTSCTEARAAAETVYQGTVPWRPPQCPHCRELVASALAEIQLQAGSPRGCRRPT